MGQLGKPTHFTGNPPAIVANPKVLGQLSHPSPALRLDFFTLASMQPAYTPYVCLPKLAHREKTLGRYRGPQTHSPPRIRCSGMNRNIKLLVKLHILDWYSSEGGFFSGWDLFGPSHVWGFQRGTGGTGGMKKDEKGRVSKW